MKYALLAPLALALVATSPAAAKSERARERAQQQWAHDGRVYNSLAECRAAKKRSRDRGAVAGAAGGAAVGAIAGGNLPETALAAGVGAVAGAAIGNNVRRC